MNRQRIIIRVHDAMGSPPRPGISLEAAFIQAEMDRTDLNVAATDDLFARMGKGELTPTLVQEAGQLLYRRLTSNPGLKRALETAASLPSGTSCPILIQLQSRPPEQLPWEALCDAGGNFLCLDRRWPVARIPLVTAVGEEPERQVEPQVRIMAVLSAAGIGARPEWEALYEAVSSVDLPIRLSLLAGEDALVEHVRALAPPAHLELSADYLARELHGPAGLINRIEQFAPNLLHFFCHGDTRGDPHLLLATRRDWAEGKKESSLDITLAQISEARGLSRHCWFLALNCCLGAAPVENSPSLARKLVENGFPAVVGMREVVVDQDAHAFCRALYPEVLEAIRAGLQGAEPSFEISWPHLLYGARHDLVQRRAGGAAPPRAAALKEWTLPVLYVREAPFKLLKPPKAAALAGIPQESARTMIDVLRGAREHLVAANAPPDTITAIDARIRDLELLLAPAAGAPGA